MIELGLHDNKTLMFHYDPMAVEKKSEQDDNKALMLHKHSHIHSLGVRRRVFTNIEKY
jgi:hypothetical protein